MEQQRWQQTETLAWTANDSPGRPPRSPSRWITGSVAATLAVTLTGIIATDALCPDHRAWVQFLASVAIVGAVVAIAQSLRDQPSAPLFAMGASIVGIAIGLIDASHDPGRGTLIAIGFAVAGLGSSIVAFRMDQLSRWGAKLADAHVAPAEVAPARPVALDAPAVAVPAPSTAPVEQPTAGERTAP